MLEAFPLLAAPALLVVLPPDFGWPRPAPAARLGDAPAAAADDLLPEALVRAFLLLGAPEVAEDRPFLVRLRSLVVVDPRTAAAAADQPTPWPRISSAASAASALAPQLPRLQHAQIAPYAAAGGSTVCGPPS